MGAKAGRRMPGLTDPDSHGAKAGRRMPGLSTQLSMGGQGRRFSMEHLGGPERLEPLIFLIAGNMFSPRTPKVQKSSLGWGGSISEGFHNTWVQDQMSFLALNIEYRCNT